MTQTQYTLNKIRLHFREPHYDERFPEDIDRILKILNHRGYTTTRQDVQQAWEAFSDTYEAGWLVLPDDDTEIFYNIMDYLYAEV